MRLAFLAGAAALIAASLPGGPARAERAPSVRAPAAGPPPFILPEHWRWDNAPPGVWQARVGFGTGSATIRASRPQKAEAPTAALDAVLGHAPPPAERGEGDTAQGQHLLFRRWTGSTGVLDAVVLDDPAPEGAAGGARTVLTLTSAGLQPDGASWVRVAFDKVVRSVRPGPAAPVPPLPPLPPDAGGLDETVTGLHFVDVPAEEGGPGVRTDVWVILFAPDGRLSRVPPAGEGGIGAHCRQHPGDCGAYRLLGGGWFHKPDRIELREGSGRYGLWEVRELPFARRGNDIDIGGTHLYPAAVLPRGAPFEGTWRMIGMSGDAVVRRELVFGHDGRFRQAELEHEPNGRDPVIPAGRYTVEDTRLILDGDDGRHASFGIVQPDADNDGALLIGDDSYLKRAPAPP